MAGQTDTAIEVVFMDRIWDKKINRGLLRWCCAGLKNILFPEFINSNASYGVGGAVNESQISWTIYTTLRHRTSWDDLKDEGKTEPDHYAVSYREPMRYGSEPIPKIERVK